MLELRGLVKHYEVGDGEPVRAVDGVSTSVGAGELVALYGPSGSGKTTPITARSSSTAARSPRSPSTRPRATGFTISGSCARR
jgi:ABC-type lipoprotein export system ATPase subunit